MKSKLLKYIILISDRPIPYEKSLNSFDENSPQDNPVSIPINDELDLHTFKPEEVKYLIPDYCKECIKEGILTVRIIHGKGTGKLREYVHAVLKKMPEVKSYRLGLEHEGSWGATVVKLNK